MDDARVGEQTHPRAERSRCVELAKVDWEAVAVDRQRTRAFRTRPAMGTTCDRHDRGSTRDSDVAIAAGAEGKTRAALRQLDEFEVALGLGPGVRLEMVASVGR